MAPISTVYGTLNKNTSNGVLPLTTGKSNDCSSVYNNHGGGGSNGAESSITTQSPTTSSPITTTTTTLQAAPCPLRAPLVVTFIGLPCRGKSLAAHRIARHLCWKGENAKVFKVDINASTETLADIISWFDLGNNVAIIDGMHLTYKSREFILRFCDEKVLHHLFVEFNCDANSLQSNIIETVKFYQNIDRNIDWMQVIKDKEKHCIAVYEPPLAGGGGSTIIHNEGAIISVNNSENLYNHSVMARGVQGAIQTSILGVLSNPVIKNQIYYFTRHGESDFNVLGRIGGDADLSHRGRCYAERLTKFFNSTGGITNPNLIWTSEFCRTVHTAQNIPGLKTAVKDLNEIHAGICEGLTYEEIQERFPQEFAWRDEDKLKYRYPHGESYLDLLQRVDSVVQALLSKTNVLVVSHQAVLRCIMAYFMGSKPDDVPYINVPLHNVLIVRTHGYDFNVETIPLQVDCVDTYRVQPKNCSPERGDADALETVPHHFDSLLLPQTTN